MSTVVSLTSKPNPPVVTKQVSTSTNELTPVTMPGNPVSGPEARGVREEALPIRESMTPLIATATTLNNDPLIKDRDVATALVDNPINDLGESEVPIPGAKRKIRAMKSSSLPQTAGLEPDVQINGTTMKSDAVEGLVRFAHAPAFGREEDIEAEQEDLSEEGAIKLADDIHKLWGDHQKRKWSVAKSRGQLKMLRASLAAQLYSYKKHLVRVGRDGGWASFLRERDIPLSTADRYVKQHEDSLTPAVGKLLPEEIKDPTKEEVSKLVKKLEPKLRSVLTTADSVTQFMAELEVALSRSASE